MNDLVNDGPHAEFRCPAFIEDGGNLIAIREADRSSGSIHQKLLGQITGNGFLILQQELLELEDIIEGIALGRDSGGIDFIPDEVHKLVPASTQTFDPLRSLAQRAVVLTPVPHDVEALQREARWIDLLVATTVIEVGVDAPDATIMVIEHAERFGLAQLHQLRGRVGRGDKPSSCLLLYHGKLGETARARLDVMRQTDDGFVIAEEDLELRGPGEFLGQRQSGVPEFVLADLSAHRDLLSLARHEAQHMHAAGQTKAAHRDMLLSLFERDVAVRFLASG